MRKTILTIAACLAFFGIAQAQWTSPGNGTTYSFKDLPSISEGTVVQVDDNTFQVLDDLTISENDALVIAPNEMVIVVSDQKTITIHGSFNCEPHDTYVEIKTENSEHYNLRFEGATGCNLSGIKFKYGGGFQLIESEVTFDDCYFVHANTQTSTGAVNYMNCNPTFKNCTFKNNDGAAISSGANVLGSPVIMNCYFYNNDITNQNLPQINLGPGADDSIRIVNNTIEGNGHDMSGGIAISNLVNMGNTKALIKGNIVKNNRYGYTQLGYAIATRIEGNQFIDNNLETDPMSGGSGISIYGYTTENSAVIRDNIIAGNLWGITAIYMHTVDLGTAEDLGGNVIYGNHNNGYGTDQEFALCDNGSNDITAIGNYWGSNDEASADAVIFDQADYGAGYGVVTYLPIAELHPDVISLTVTQEANPQLIHDYQGSIDAANHIITLTIPGLELDQVWLNVDVELPLGASCDLIAGESINLADPVTFTVSTPHDENQEWTIVLESDWGVVTDAASRFDVYANAVHQLVVSSPCDKTVVRVYDLMGRLVDTQMVGEGVSVLSTSSYCAGVYSVVLESSEMRESFRVAITR